MKQRVRFVAITVTFLSVASVFVLLRELPAIDTRRTPAHPDQLPLAVTKLQRQSEENTPQNQNGRELPASKSREKLFEKSKDANTRQERLNKTRVLDEAIDKLLEEIRLARLVDLDLVLGSSYTELLSSLGQEYRNAAPRLELASNMNIDKFAPNHKRFHYGIQKYSLYNPDDPAIDRLLHDMATRRIVFVEMMSKGTMLKLLVTFDDGGKAVFKPMRWGRDYETLPNQFYFNDFERHNSEIASFHLDRLLGFYAVPPVTGRVLNMTRDIYMLAEKKLQKTFFVSPIGNLCFFGECSYYCDSRHAFCGTVDQIEGSLMAFLPQDAKPLKWKSPYRRSYSRTRSADWEKDPSYCQTRVKPIKPFKNSSQLLLSLIDTHIFDFLTGNMDRHHVNLFADFGNDSTLIHMDNGRGFGKTTRDELSILAPLRQCCVVRQSTLLKFLSLDRGPSRLSQLMDLALRTDPVYPIIVQGHYDAMDRRVKIVLADIAACVKRTGSLKAVIIENPI